MIKKNQLVEFEITGITNEGNGVGRADGMAVFVPQTAVGDYVSVKIVKVLKSYAFGIVDNIINPSPYRKEPDCPVFRKCGGCSFRHIEYEEELRVKSSFVKDSFERIGGFNIEPEPILGCEDINYYRNKAQYPVAMLDGKAVCGFYANRSHRIVPYTGCLLQPVIFQQIVDYVIDYINANKISAYDEITGNGLVRHIYLRRGYHSGEIMLCIVSTGKRIVDSIRKMTETTDFLKKFPDVKSVIVNLNPEKTNVILGKKNITVWGTDNITDIMCGNKISLSPMSFYQVNTEQAEKLYSIAAEFADLKGDEEVFDLYCGAGTIGLSMIDKINHLTGVEVVKQAVENAKANAEANNIKNADFICGDAGEIADRLQKEGKRPDVIIVDPPRKGCDALSLEAIVKMAPEKIVMISCNPATAARDCKILCSEESGYELKRVRGCDLFPGTCHVETVVLLSQQKADDYVEVELELDELDVTSAESKATYAEIKDYVLKEHGLKVSNLYISQVKRKCGIEVGENNNLRKATRRMDCLQADSTTAANLEKLVSQGSPKSEDSKQPQCPEEKEKAIKDALEHFGMV